MNTLSLSTLELAQRLLALEAKSESGADLRGQEAVRVCEKLRVSLTRFAGPDGFNALLRRALTLARADVPALQAVIVNPGGRLEGFEEIAADARNAGSDAATAIAAHLLGLLITFIGEPLTLRLVREAWPDSSLEKEG